MNAEREDTNKSPRARPPVLPPFFFCVITPKPRVKALNPSLPGNRCTFL